MEYYWAIKRRKSIVTTWMNLEGLMLSEISQTEKDNTVWPHSHVESKKTQLQKLSRWVVSRGGQWGNGWGWLNGTDFQLLRWISSGDVIYSMVTVVNNAIDTLYIFFFFWYIVYFKLLRDRSLKFSPNASCNCVSWWMC